MSGLESTLDEPVSSLQAPRGCIFPPVLFSPPHQVDGVVEEPGTINTMNKIESFALLTIRDRTLRLR